MANQFQANLGQTIVLNQAMAVTSQYGESPGNGGSGNGGYQGAQARWQGVLDSPKQEDCASLQVFTINTWLGNYELPDTGESPTAVRNLSVLGRLEYGIGGADFSVDFDWKNGNQLTVVASFVRVKAAFSTTGTLIAPSKVTIGAMFASGGRPARAQATRTYPQVIASDSEETGTVIFPVPPMAHGLYLFSEEPEFYEVGNAQIRFLGGANNGFSAPSTGDLVSFVTDGVPFLQALGNEDGVRFPESVKYIEVTGADEAQDFHITPCFTLNL